MTLDRLQEYCLAHAVEAIIDGDYLMAAIYRGAHLIGHFNLLTGRYYPNNAAYPIPA